MQHKTTISSPSGLAELTITTNSPSPFTNSPNPIKLEDRGPGGHFRWSGSLDMLIQYVKLGQAAALVRRLTEAIGPTVENLRITNGG